MSANLNKVDTIRGILMGVAAKGQTITYGHLAKIGRIRRSDVRGYLNRIWQEEEQSGKPDVTLVVVRAGRPSLPSFFDGKLMKNRGDWIPRILWKYHNHLEQVYKYYDPAK